MLGERFRAEKGDEEEIRVMQNFLNSDAITKLLLALLAAGLITFPEFQEAMKQLIADLKEAAKIYEKALEDFDDEGEDGDDG